MPPRPTFDLYEALQIDATATEGEITSAYRRLARDHHPDKNPDNAEATAKMQKVCPLFR
jgi:DnaJ-class molecular chaperone